jgi:hypothetical protein
MPQYSFNSSEVEDIPWFKKEKKQLVFCFAKNTALKNRMRATAAC